MRLNVDLEALHYDLWRTVATREPRRDDIHLVNGAGKLFATYRVSKRIKLMTQNLRKDTDTARRCREDDVWITWIVEDGTQGGYLGKVEGPAGRTRVDVEWFT